MRILIADDDQLTRAIRRQHVSAWNHEPVEAVDGLDAWEKLSASDAPRLAILDWIMPNINGLNICRRLIEPQARRLTYTILLTSHDGECHVAEALRRGAYDFQPKPIDPEQLFARVNGWHPPSRRGGRLQQTDTGTRPAYAYASN